LKRLDSARLIVLGCVFWLVVLGCRTSDFVAQANPTAARTATRTVRPTFTLAPPTQPPPPDTLPPPPPAAPSIVPTRPPTARPVPTRPPASPTPAPPPPTPDPYAGFYYKPTKKICVTAPNTRIEGTVYDRGVSRNGIRVRVSDREGGDPSIDDFITGTDPSDYKHIDPALQGKYRLALYEGLRNAGNWWVFIIDDSGNLLSPGVLITTQDGGGCNTATVDFSH